MRPTEYPVETDRYAKRIEGSKRICWYIGRGCYPRSRARFFTEIFPYGISKLDQLDFLNDGERRVFSRIQVRTYVNMFGFRRPTSKSKLGHI